jgi:alpha-L-rhamnosidase
MPYAGRTLGAGHTYYWQVQVWDNHCHASSWPEHAAWQMGLLSPQDWHGARWIAYEQLPTARVNVLPVDGAKDTYRDNNTLPLLRKTFVAKKRLAKATLFISGLGEFETLLNGQKVCNHFLDPGWTKYDKQAQYVTFDVT